MVFFLFGIELKETQRTKKKRTNPSDMEALRWPDPLPAIEIRVSSHCEGNLGLAHTDADVRFCASRYENQG